MCNIPNYQPANNPFAPKPAPPLPPIPDSIKHKAKSQGCEFISKDGGTGYCWRYGKMYECHAPGFAAWEPVIGPELPAGTLEAL